MDAIVAVSESEVSVKQFGHGLNRTTFMVVGAGVVSIRARQCLVGRKCGPIYCGVHISSGGEGGFFLLFLSLEPLERIVGGALG